VRWSIRALNIPLARGLPKVHHRFVGAVSLRTQRSAGRYGGNSAAEVALFLSEEGVRTTMATGARRLENQVIPKPAQ